MNPRYHPTATTPSAVHFRPDNGGRPPAGTKCAGLTAWRLFPVALRSDLQQRRHHLALTVPGSLRAHVAAYCLHHGDTYLSLGLRYLSRLRGLCQGCLVSITSTRAMRCALLHLPGFVFQSRSGPASGRCAGALGVSGSPAHNSNYDQNRAQMGCYTAGRG